MSDLEIVLESRYGEIKELLSDLTAQESEPLCKHPTVPTLKATLFLLFYNLIESVIYTAFEMVFDAIAGNCVSFSNLTANVQKQYKRFDKNATITEAELLSLSLSKYLNNVTLFSGNLDARSIRKLMNEWDIDSDFHFRGEEKLLTIKNYRNVLAHGERSFKDVGRGYTMKEMREFGEILFDYLNALIQIIELYLKSKGYLIH